MQMIVVLKALEIGLPHEEYMHSNTLLLGLSLSHYRTDSMFWLTTEDRRCYQCHRDCGLPGRERKHEARRLSVKPARGGFVSAAGSLAKSGLPMQSLNAADVSAGSNGSTGYDEFGGG